ncbi:SpoIID/LytB domain-containing protein [Phormidium sp. CCY1219]|uniref:SpoIID/LytB domain-containing protein n=1 Tax=Phormidium sp. CCY1219 TaxID=2886104 RepID=UPI002D1EA7DD|nr:SpoIID/LytB domain-containing protein [Phormidium sp. CCY1219]MEB3826959.1 SpoIID/LytB domain-containing protein [Phormidium sp. CCY1219]
MKLLSQLQPLWQSRRYVLFVALLWLMMVAPARAALLLRIAIEEDVSSVKVGSSTPARVANGAGRPLGEIDGMQASLARAGGSQVNLGSWKANRMTIDPTGDGFVYIGDRWYRGRLVLVATPEGLIAINAVNLEEYLYSVVGAEMSPSWPGEALKAQAVAARTYALYQRQNRGNDLYDLGDDTFWQVYNGVEKEASTTHAAVQATAGQALVHNGQLIEAVYHASSGGHTENVEDVWTHPRPYLRGVPDYDSGTPTYQWTETFSRNELSARISGVGNVVSMEPESTTPHGRIVTMRVVGDAGVRSIAGESLRQALNLRSTRFTVLPEYGSSASKNNLASAPIQFTIQGRGFGHGVGMSQWGAYNLARRGVNYQQILLHYYQNANLAKIRVE